MTNREILKKVIEKAEKNGFNNNKINCFDVWDIPPKLYVRFLICNEFAKAFWRDAIICNSQSCIPLNYEEIYSESFWGDIKYLLSPTKLKEGAHLWKFYLQQMVLEEEPLKYLEQFLDE